MNAIRLGNDITALYNSRGNGSEVLFFQRNTGLICRMHLPEKGERLESKLMRAMNSISAQELPIALYCRRRPKASR